MNIEQEFTCSLLAFTDAGYKHCPALIIARNIDEASGIAIRLGQKIFPPRDGYHNHSQAVTSSKELKIQLME